MYISISLIVKCFRQLSLGDPQGYPLCLDDIMERKFAFRLKWQTSWGGQASVVHYQCLFLKFF
jgi:hypothetical protein